MFNVGDKVKVISETRFLGAIFWELIAIGTICTVVDVHGNDLYRYYSIKPLDGELDGEFSYYYEESELLKVDPE